MRAPQDFHKRCGTSPPEFACVLRRCRQIITGIRLPRPSVRRGCNERKHGIFCVLFFIIIGYAMRGQFIREHCVSLGLTYIRSGSRSMWSIQKSPGNPKLSSPVIPDKTKTPRAPRGPSSECRFMSLFIKMCGCTHCLFMRCQGFILLS